METLRQLDLQAFYFINQTIANDLFDILCPIIRDKLLLAAFYGVFAIIIFKQYPEQFFKIVIAAAITILLTDQVSASVIKPFVQRIRPCNNPHVTVRLIVEQCGSGLSFVSAHATTSFGMATFLSILLTHKKGLIAFLIIWASLVSFTQVYVGVHYPGDVIAGGILGIFIGAVTGTITRRSIFYIPPVKSPQSTVDNPQ